MARRILIFVLIAGVIAALAGGAWFFLHRRGRYSQLDRARISLSAKKFEDAANQAAQYIRENPTDHQGYVVRARALNSLQRHEEAREVLQEGKSHQPEGKIDIQMALAESYSMPATQALMSSQRYPPVEKLQAAIENFDRAREILDELDAVNEKDKLQLHYMLGVICRNQGRAYDRLAGLFRREAESAQAGGVAELARQKREARQEAADQADQACARAINEFSTVVRIDPTLERAAVLLVDTCVQQQDFEALEDVRDVILSAENPPPLAVSKLEMYEVATLSGELSQEEYIQRVRQAADRLDVVLKENPTVIEVQLDRAELAMWLGNNEKAQQLVENVLKEDSRQRQALLLEAMLMVRRGERAQAVRQLSRLRAQHPDWPVAHVRYAQLASQYPQYVESAREAMTFVLTELDPDNAQALKFMARSLSEEGLQDATETAFRHADRLYKTHPDDPDALTLLLEIARKTDREQLAADVMEKVAADPNASITQLASIAQAYERRAESLMQTYPQQARKLQSQARAIADRLVKGEPRNVPQTIAISRAHRYLGEDRAAEQLLSRAVEKYPETAALRFEMGQLYGSTERSALAIEEYRKASKLAPGVAEYKVTLAAELIAAGNLERAASVLETVDSPNDRANLLKLQIALAQGKDLDEAIQEGAFEGKSGLQLAAVYLQRGRPDEAIRICRESLEDRSDNQQARMLLVQALLASNRRDQAVSELQKVLRAQPRVLTPYLALAQIWQRSGDLKDVREKLTDVRNAREYMVNMAMASLEQAGGRPGEAIRSYQAVWSHADAPEHVAAEAKLRQAALLARMGRLEQAMTLLDQLTEGTVNRRRAMLSKVNVYQAMGKELDAMAVLKDLHQTAVRQGDRQALAELAIYVAKAMKHRDDALAICDDLQEIAPADAQTYVTRAQVQRIFGDLKGAIASLRKAAGLQPQRLGLRVSIATLLDLNNEPLAALEELRKLEDAGASGLEMSVFQRAEMLRQWGLDHKAAEVLKELSGRDEEVHPRLLLALARTTMAVGDRKEARRLLERVPVHSDRYVPSRLMLAELSETDDAKIAVLDGLLKDRPKDMRVHVQRIRHYLQSERPDQALEAFRSSVQELTNDRYVQPILAGLAMDAYQQKGDLRGAARLAERMTRQTGSPLWANITAMLTAKQDPQAALKLLPEPKAASGVSVLIGVCIAQTSDDRERLDGWLNRIEEINEQFRKQRVGVPVSPPDRILALLAAGRVDQAAKIVEALPDGDPIGVVTRQHLQTAREGYGTYKETSRDLLLLSIARDFRLNRFAGQWAMEILDKNPRCQWAAWMGARDLDSRRKVLSRLKPKESFTAAVLRADMWLDESKPDRAVKVLERAVEDFPESAYMKLRYGAASETAGQRDQALSIYESLMEKLPNHRTLLNNAAYSITQLHPDDKEKLAKARQYMDKAVRNMARPPATLIDTRGWISHLMGEHQQAVALLRQSIRGMTDSPQAHYHVAEAEKARGMDQVAKWHYQAAVDLGKKAKAENRTLLPDEQDAVRKASQALKQGTS